MVYSTGPRQRRQMRPMPATGRSSGPLRLQRRDPLLGSDHVHGGWWPYSRDLETELPTLLEALASGGFAPYRVLYSTRGWDDAPRALSLPGSVVTLAGYYTQHAATLVITDTPHLRPLVLMVVPHTMDPLAAATAMAAAAEDGNEDRIVDILEQAMAQISTEPPAT